MNPDASAPDSIRLLASRILLREIRIGMDHLDGDHYRALRLYYLNRCDWLRRWHFPADDPMYTVKGTLPRDLNRRLAKG